MLKIAGKIPIRIHPIFWLLALGIGWLNTEDITKTLVWMVIIVVSVLFHEFGHALTALAFGQKSSIDLVGLGGLTTRRGGKLSLWKEFLIVLNGPVFGFILAGLAYYIWQKQNWSNGSILQYAFGITWVVNVFWTVLNLLPVQPLDGGKLLGILLESVLGVRGIKISYFLSMIIAAGVSVYALLAGEFLIGAFFLMFTFESYKGWQGSLVVTPQDQDMALQLQMKDAENEMRNGNKEEALVLFQKIREKSIKGVLYIMATQHMADIYNKQGRLQDAYNILTPVSAKLSPEYLRLLLQVAFQTRQLDSAVALGNKVYQTYPSYDVALTNSMSYALKGEDRPAVGWLQRAITDGLPNSRMILDKKEFDNIRGSPLFQSLQQKSV